MPRGMDVTFHRLLWITLVVVAFTFTVILTSVFVDIDDLLAKRSPSLLKQQSVTEAPRTEVPAAFVDDFQNFPSNEDDTDENESTFRTKRSLESKKYLLHIKSPKMKKVLTNRLATLLEELDEEESSRVVNTEALVLNSKDKNIGTPKYLSTEVTAPSKESIDNNIINVKVTDYDKLRNEMAHKNVLHLMMHNILLQGIIGHMDLNEVYKRVHTFIKNSDTNSDNDAKEQYESKFNKSKQEEAKFITELTNCETLQKEILQNQQLRNADKKETAQDSHMLIKTIIEITNNNRKNLNVRNSHENTTGTIKLVYNGKEIKSENMIDDKNLESETIQNLQTEENQRNIESFTKKISTERHNIKESELDRAIEDYLKTHSIKFHNKYDLIAKNNFLTKRLKRQIKIHYLDEQVTTEKSKRLKRKPKHPDDELYVEIETHFDGKGTKGEKKKKLVRTLIDKIQKAINSNAEVLNQDKTVQQRHLQIKKRMQNPIDHNDVNTITPIDVIQHRQLNPISKTASVIQPLKSVLDKSGDTWKKIYNGPSFLAASKSLNSAEMRELDIDYNSVLKNGIPKRLQKPINTENEHLMKVNEYSDVSNVTLYLKDINGSGFSIGINQYADEPPDKETLKMFTGLENLIQAYHEHYDQAETISNESEEPNDFIVDNHEVKKRDVNKEAKLINQELNAKRIIRNEKQDQKHFKFSDSSRYKQSALKVKLFSNIKSKTKLNKFINTNAMATKKIFLKSKRNKRQIEKIRILATDRYPSISGEDIFLVSQENMYADRAIVKDLETPEVDIGERNEEHYDFIAPYSYNMDVPKLPPAYLSSTYDTKSLHTGLMSKYPHIFLENIPRPEEFININPSNTIEEKSYRKVNAESKIQTVNNDKSTEQNMSSTNVNDIVNAILPSRNNLKVVVKIFPKNKTEIGPGYKEVHTLINKSYDKNGVRYVSSLNVSEVSKFESLNKSKEDLIWAATNKSEMERRQNQVKLLLELHKERIDQQLQHLKIERQKLKEMIGHEEFNKNMSHLIEVFRQLGIKSIKEDADDNYNNIHLTTISNTILPKFDTTMNPIFTTINRQDEYDKLKMLSSIKENENITRKILQKIDNNTNILQLFLQKFFDPMQSTPQLVVNTERVVTQDTPNYSIGDQVIHPFLEQLHTNYTGAIPFIYAFQHPLMENKNKPHKTVANVIYHGHIHAKRIENDENKNDFLKSLTNNLKIENKKKFNNNRGTSGNQTKFFIDELENDFKLVSNVNNRVPVLSAVKMNFTKI